MLLLSQKRYHSESYCVKNDLLCIVIQAILNRYNASNSVESCGLFNTSYSWEYKIIIDYKLFITIWGSHLNFSFSVQYEHDQVSRIMV